MTAIPDITNTQAELETPREPQEPRPGGTLRQFIGWFLEHVPDGKFDMRQWMTLQVGDLRIGDAVALSVDDFDFSVPVAGKADMGRAGTLLPSGREKITADRNFDCLSAACIVGWAQLWNWAELWNTITDDPKTVYPMLRHPTDVARWLADGHKKAAFDMLDVFFDYDIKTPRQASERLLAIADRHGL